MITNEHIAWAQRLHSAILVLIIIGLILIIDYTKPKSTELPPNTYQISFNITLDELDNVPMEDIYQFVNYYLEQGNGICPNNQLLEYGMGEMNVSNLKIEY